MIAHQLAEIEDHSSWKNPLFDWRKTRECSCGSHCRGCCLHGLNREKGIWNKTEKSRLVWAGNWRVQVKVCGKNKVRKGESAKPFVLNRTRLVGTVLKETLFYTSCFPITSVRNHLRRLSCKFVSTLYAAQLLQSGEPTVKYLTSRQNKNSHFQKCEHSE